MNWLKSLRTKHGWTQDELAEKLECSPSFVSDIENGRRKFSVDMLGRLAEETGYAPAFVQYCQAKEQEEFTLPMPTAQVGRLAAQRLIACWATMKEEEYQAIVDMAITTK